MIIIIIIIKDKWQMAKRLPCQYKCSKISSTGRL